MHETRYINRRLYLFFSYDNDRKGKVKDKGSRILLNSGLKNLWSRADPSLYVVSVPQVT